MSIKYKGGYKYQLKENYLLNTTLKPVSNINTSFIELATTGQLKIKVGYAWDGPTDPAIDTKNFMRGSLVHDALYQLMREGHLPHEHKEFSDRLLVQICKEDGMSSFRAWYVYQAVHFFGRAKTDPAEDHQILTAP